MKNNMFEINKTTNTERLGVVIGFLFSCALSSAVLFYLLNTLNKIPSKWNYFNIVAIVLIIVLLGAVTKRYFK